MSEELLRDHAEEIAALPADDPLREALARSGDALGADAQAELDREAELLRRQLRQVEVPELEYRLRTVPRKRGRSPLVAALAIAAALLLAFLLGQRLAPTPDQPAAATVAPAPASDATRDGPRVIAVKWWHVTCPACKELDPRYADVIASFDESEVLFVTFDMSTPLSRRQSALLASALGLRDVYDEVFGSSGFVVLFDAESKQRLGKLSATQEREEMKSSIRDALSRARS